MPNTRHVALLLLILGMVVLQMLVLLMILMHHRPQLVESILQCGA